ncbi:MAG: hypothetical protein ACKN89_04350 [Cyanobium sp.]|jgi:hypothetical protein
MAKKSKPARGLIARGTKGAPRQKLARAAGFGSDAEIVALFPERRHKQVRQLQQTIADLVSALGMTDQAAAAVARQYGALIRALAQPDTPAEPDQPEPGKAPESSARSAKQSALATDALRQMVLEALQAPLALLPSLLADDSLSDQQKLQRLSIYTAALEAVYEPLELEPIGEPGEATQFDPRHHDSAAALSKGDACTIRQIGLSRGDAVVRKAVVVAGE